jgi:hypothetical protein
VPELKGARALAIQVDADQAVVDVSGFTEAGKAFLDACHTFIR